MSNIANLIEQLFPGTISLSPEQIAQILNIHVRSVHRGMKEGTLPLPTVLVGRERKRVLITDFVDFLETRRVITGKRRRGRPVGSRNKHSSESGNA